MSSHKRTKRAVNKTGRNKHDPFVKLSHFVLNSPAYKSMNSLSRSVYTELRKRYNGQNNGEISCSVRELERELHCSKDSAGKALKELVAKGFIKCAQAGSFHYKVRHAATWILTDEELSGMPPTKDFMRWQPGEKKNGPKSGTGCPQNRTEREDGSPEAAVSVPELGPSGTFAQLTQS